MAKRDYSGKADIGAAPEYYDVDESQFKNDFAKFAVGDVVSVYTKYQRSIDLYQQFM